MIKRQQRIQELKKQNKTVECDKCGRLIAFKTADKDGYVDCRCGYSWAPFYDLNSLNIRY